MTTPPRHLLTLCVLLDSLTLLGKLGSALGDGSNGDRGSVTATGGTGDVCDCASADHDE